jgi:integrase
MAYFRKVKGGWRAEVARGGRRLSATFPHKATAQTWASQQENDIVSGKVGRFPLKTVSDAIDRYEREVSSQKRGRRAEGLRFRALEREFPALCAMVIADVKTPDLVLWRDARLKLVSKGSVQRDINLLRNVWTVAVKEWHWCGESPWTALRMPGDNPARTQRIRWQDVRRIVRWLGYRTGQRPATKYQEVAWAFMIALRTAMRAGEVMGLTRETISLGSRVVRLDAHKTLETVGVRYVPLTKHGARLLGVLCAGAEPLWTIKTASLDTLFRKARDSCLLNDLHFHDARAEALTLLSRRMDILTLARISGHKDLRELMGYFRESPEQIAARI